MEANSTTQNHHHAIIFPLHLQGHINPCAQLTLKLASRGFTITFLTFEHVHQNITQARPHHTGMDSHDIFEEARRGSDGLDIRYRVISDGLPLDYDRPGRLMEYLEWYLHGGLYDHLVEEVRKIVLDSKPRVNVLIFDTFYPWASKLAKKFALRSASFWTEPALVFNLYYHVHLLRQNGHLDCADPRKDPIDYIPGVESLEPKDLMSYLQDKDISTNMHKLIFQAYQDVRSADYVLCNTVEELEPDSILALQALMPFYAIGPIFLSASTKRVMPTSLWAESTCSEWLNSKSDGSVLYVSFGSLATFTKNDVMEIAYGLRDSKVDFIWVLRPRSVVDESNDLLPLGFKEDVNGRGIVVPWTNQIEVLSHHAIGGFLTHCGWNSVLESIWCNIPMLCFPVFTDQYTNRKLVVDDWKIGVNFCSENAKNRVDIAAQIKSFMSPKYRDKLIHNFSDVRIKLQSALEAHGSSEKNVDRFIERLNE